MEVYAGLGIAERTISYNNVVSATSVEETLWVEWLPQPILFEGKDIIFHTAAGFKLGWIFWRKK